MSTRSLTWLACSAVLIFLAMSMVVDRSPWTEGDQWSDVEIYEKTGEPVLDGEVPYRDVAMGYPPGSLLAFVVPALVADEHRPGSYEHAFAWMMRLCGVAVVLLTAASLRTTGASTRHTAAALGVLALAPILLGRPIIQRFDLLPAAMFAVALAALLRRRDRLAFAALGLAVATKLYPVAALPVFVGSVWRRRGPRAAAITTIVFAAVMILMTAPFAVLAPDGLQTTFASQSNRPLNRETIAGGALLVLHQLTGISLHSAVSHGSGNFVGNVPDALAFGSSLVQAAALAWVWLITLRSRLSYDTVVVATAATIVMFVVFGRVLSPQFVIWLLPLVPLVRGRFALLTALLAFAMALTQAYFPSRYALITALDPTTTWVIAARNVVLLALVVVLAWILHARVRNDRALEQKCH